MSGEAIKATDGDVDRVDRSSTEDFKDAVADLFQFESPFDFVWEAIGKLDCAVAIEEVRSMEQMDVQNMAFDPFSAVDQASQLFDWVRDIASEDRFEGLYGRHLISDWADTADARSDIGNILDGSPFKEGFEESRRFVDVQLDPFYEVSAKSDIEGPFPFNAGEDRDADGTLFGHGSFRVAMAGLLVERLLVVGCELPEALAFVCEFGRGRVEGLQEKGGLGV